MDAASPDAFEQRYIAGIRRVHGWNSGEWTDTQAAECAKWARGLVAFFDAVAEFYESDERAECDEILEGCSVAFRVLPKIRQRTLYERRRQELANAANERRDP